MINVKRLLTLVLALAVVMCVCACGGTSEDEGTSETTTTPTTQATEKTEPTDAPTESEGTSEPTEEEVAEPSYTVTVVDEAGNPIAGVMLQMCLDTCVPGKTDENGVAEFFLDEAEYKVSLLNMPEGYDYSTEEQEWYFAEGENALTVVLKSAA